MAHGPEQTEAPQQDAPHCAFGPARRLPPPEFDPPCHKLRMPAIAVLAGGCFWGVQAVFQHVPGVSSVLCGYCGGNPAMANYEAVCSGHSGHAEAVQITFDPVQVSYGQLLMVFFAIAHDPTQRDRQGPDIGSQYRSAIFTSNDQQQQIANAYVRQLDGSAAFAAPIATRIEPLGLFHPAEAYHQNYALQHPHNPYVASHDLPKIDQLQTHYPELFRTVSSR